MPERQSKKIWVLATVREGSESVPVCVHLWLN